MGDFSRPVGAGRRLDLAKVPAAQRLEYHKWVRLFLYFCQKFGYGPNLPTSQGPFLNKPTAVKEPVDHVVQAAAAIRLLLRRGREPGDTIPVQAAQVPPSEAAPSPGLEAANPGQKPQGATRPVAAPPAGKAAAGAGIAPVPGWGASWEREYRELEAANFPL